MVFQNYALFPHLDVWENVAFGLKSRGDRRDTLDAKVDRALALVEMAPYARRKVQALSGGQQQRVALARALAPEPPLLLLDEPLSNLDAALRERTRDELRALLKQLGMTAVFVTHDQEEAFALSDRVAVLDRGRLQQVGTPETLYATPVNAFVASFLGRANFFPATVDSVDGDRAVCRLPGGGTWTARLAADAPRKAGAPLRLMVRPEALALVSDWADGTLPGRVLDRRFAGASTFYRVGMKDGFEVLVQGRPRRGERGRRREPCPASPRRARRLRGGSRLKHGGAAPAKGRRRMHPFRSNLARALRGAIKPVRAASLARPRLDAHLVCIGAALLTRLVEREGGLARRIARGAAARVRGLGEVGVNGAPHLDGGGIGFERLDLEGVQVQPGLAHRDLSGRGMGGRGRWTSAAADLGAAAVVVRVARGIVGAQLPARGAAAFAAERRGQVRRGLEGLHVQVAEVQRALLHQGFQASVGMGPAAPGQGRSVLSSRSRGRSPRR